MATVSLQSAFDAARRALDTGAADKAVAVARYILAHYPRNIEAQRLLGEALLNAGDAEAAAEAFERVLDADPESVAAYYGRGLAFAARGDRAAAVRSFERALEIQPNLAELRTQLIRMYGETPNSSPQLRLSRAGLARLYTRGGMYGQAVDEFRAIEAEADRPDVEAALAEALWRDGQEDEAAAYCRETLERRLDLLKPRLLLGYLLYAGGQPEGEELWRAAAQQDPTLTVARGLFDILPPIRLEDPLLPAFDVDELLARGYGAEPAVPLPPVEDVAARQPPASLAAARAEPIAEQPLSAGAADATLAHHSASTDQEASPLADETKHPSRQFELPPPRDMLSDDELLASLLGIDVQPAQTQQPSLPALDAPAAAEAPAGRSGQPATARRSDTHGGEHGMQAAAQPFSLDDSDSYAVEPFSLQDDQADEDDTAATPAEAFGREAAGSPTAEDETDGLELFTLDELAYDESDASLASTAGVNRAAPWDEPAEAPTALPDRPQPAFALGEQSRSEESDAAPFDELPAAGDAAAPEIAEPVPQPGATRDLFSLDDLADDAASWEQEPHVSSDEEEQMPFSLAELGIDAEQFTARPGSEHNTTPAADMPLLGWEPYAPELAAPSLGDAAGTGQDSATPEHAVRVPAPPAQPPGDTASFSLADLGLTDEEIAALDLNDVELAQDETDRPAEHAAAPLASTATAEATSNAIPAPNGLRTVFQQLDADPDNPSLRLAVARITIQSGDTGQALEHYRQLVRAEKLLDDVAGDLQDLLDEAGAPQLLRRLHRLLGDIYMKQNRVQEAMDQYSWTTERQ